MKIISHRGYWKKTEEKNLAEAFERSFSLGYGTETDFRDYLGELVISHDIASADCISAKDCFELYNKFNCNATLALNIKSDGLQKSLKKLIQEYNIKNYFVFDMSIPDTLGYIDHDIRFFSRQSEYEPVPAFYDACAGIWLDAFKNTWYSNKIIFDHLNNNKQVAIVSSELHKRSHVSLWQQLKTDNLHEAERLILCTDIPEKATEFFQ